MKKSITRQTRRSAARGFTLIELLVVLAILALIAGLAAPRVLDYLGGARGDAAQIQIKALETSLDLFRLDIGRYPTGAEGLAALVERPAGAARWTGRYVKSREMLNDPWGRPYRYRQPGKHGPYDLFTLGADDKEGGEGEDRDITNW